MAVNRTAAATAQARATAQAQAQRTLASTASPSMLVSPYDGTSPLLAGTVAGDPTGALSGTGRPQVNATNQSALAPNGDVNQSVTNENHYYNIIMPRSPWNSFLGYLGLGNGHPTFDPATGAYYVQRESGIVGWIKRLFRGY